MSIQNMEQFLKYIKLDLTNIPDTILNSDNIDIKSSEINNQKNYKVYRYISVKDINIVFVNNRRLDEPSKKNRKYARFILLSKQKE